MENDKSIAAPQFPHDDFSFAELSSAYNYDLTSDRRRVLVQLLIKECASRQGPIYALDVGCGTGISEQSPENEQYLAAVRDHVDELWGVEPDASVTPKHSLFTNFQHAILETAKLPQNYFNIAYAYFVLEHVDDPKRFMLALHRCLRPGGVFIFITPNARHYFTKAAKFLRSVRLDEWVLRRIRGASVDAYHYPVRYRCNSEAQINQLARECGFLSPHYAYIERGGPRQYFRGPFVLFYHLLVWKRRVIRNKQALLELLCRMEKPGNGNSIAQDFLDKCDE